MSLPLTGNRCYCTQCDEYFNSVAAFDFHLKGEGRGKRKNVTRRHDISGMQRNEAGYLVVQAWEGGHLIGTTPREGGSS